MDKILFRAEIGSKREYIYWNELGQIRTVEGLDTYYEYQDRYYTNISSVCGLIHNDTIGQYTGFYDKNKAKIFGGDTVIPLYKSPMGEATQDLDEDYKGILVYHGCEWGIEQPNKTCILMRDYLNWKVEEYVSNYGNRIELENNICNVVVVAKE